MENKNEFPKRNEMVMLKGNNLSVYAHKTLDYIYREGLDFYKDKKRVEGTYGIYELNIHELKEEIGMKGRSHEKIIKELEAIDKLIFETYDDKHYSKFPILAGFELEKNGVLRVALSPFLVEKMMFNTENIYYHMSNLLEFKELKSKYSKRILELHKRYHGDIPKLEILKFQGLMQYPEKYKNFDVERRVLEQAKQELKEKNNMILEWEIEKARTKWKNIKLNITELLEKKEEVIEFSSRMLLTLERARKNRFIDASYSRKAMAKIVTQYDEKDILKALREAYKYNSEIINFSKFLISKIKDIQESKIRKLEEKEKIKVENRKILSKVEILKGEIAKILMKSKGSSKLFEKLEGLKTIEELEKFKLDNF